MKGHASVEIHWSMFLGGERVPVFLRGKKAEEEDNESCSNDFDAD